MTGTVSGSVFYRERIALPEDAIVVVRLVGVASVLSEQTIEPQGRQVPIPFELSYEDSEIDADQSYSVEAEIRLGEQFLFENADVVPVITQGNPTSDVGILLHSVPQ